MGKKGKTTKPKRARPPLFLGQPLFITPADRMSERPCRSAADALRLLDLLIAGGGKRRRRDLCLLASPSGGVAPDWAMTMPQCWCQALDVQLTTVTLNKDDGLDRLYKTPIQLWTQGRLFCFEPGHIIYNRAVGSETWSQTVAAGARWYMVKEATPARWELGARDPGRVVAQVWDSASPRAAKRPLVTWEMTQDDFVRLLITGDYAAEHLAQAQGADWQSPGETEHEADQLTLF